MKKIKLVLICIIISYSLIGQITYTFTPCSASGRVGPTQAQINSAYAATNLNGLVQSLTGIQSWTVPQSGAYRIQTYGAAGGGNGGAGASTLGDFTLTAGQVLKIVVGQRGINGTGSPSNIGGGGGGGSFVVSGTNSLLIAAGGGGGGLVGGSQGGTGLSGASGGSIYNSGGGTGGNGGQSGITNGDAAGGGGFLTNGGNSANPSQLPCEGGKSFLNGSEGGQSGYNSGYFGGHGGFGGGGSGWHNSLNRCGGGGGYSGGQGGTWSSSPSGPGGGGGSYNSGINQTNTSGVNSGTGLVTLTRLYGVNISQTSNVLCNGLTTAALSSTVNGGVSPFTYTWLPSGGNTFTASGLAAGVYSLTVKDANNVLTESSYTITQPSTFSVSSSQTNATCYGLSNGTANLLVSGATSPYTYTWLPTGGNASSASSLAAGVFSINIKDANNCTTSTSLTITQPASLVVTASVNNAAVCAGASVIFSGAGANSYAWSGGASNGIAYTPAASGIYTVTGTVGACTQTATVGVTVNPNPIITVNSGVICAGQNFTINPNGANTYTIQGGNAVVSPAGNTSYTVAGTSTAGCVSQAFATSNLTVNPNPIITVNNGAICAGQNFTINPNGANTYTIQGGSAVVSPTSNASFTVAGTSTAGCVSQAFATSSLIVNANPIITVNSGAICAGQNFTINPNGANTYTIQGGNAVVSPAGNTSYTVAGTSTAGCVSQAFATSNLTVNPNPIITVNNGAICAGQNFTINPNGANTYTIQGGSAVVSPTSNASFTISGTSTAGCLSQAFATSNLTVNPNPTITVNNGTICVGQNFTINPNGANTYTIQGGNAVVSPPSNAIFTVAGTSTAGCVSQAVATSSLIVNQNPTITVNNGAICVGQSFTLNPAGANTYTIQNVNAVVSPSVNSTYTVIGTNTITGCRSQSFATSNLTVNPNPTVSISGPSVVCLGDSISLVANGANTYVWNNNATTTTIVITPTTTSTYSAVGTDTNGCVGLSASKSVTVNPVPILSIISTATAICVGDTVKFTAAGANSYVWNIGDNDSLIVVTPTITTTYSVVGTNGFGCTSTKTDSVKVNALPNITISGTTGTICIGENITLTANGANTYTWSGNINTNSIAVSPSVSTTYSASGTSTDGCVGSNTLQLNVTECTNIKTIASKSAIKVYPNPNHGEFIIELISANNSNITITNVLGQIIKTQKAELMNQIDLNAFDKGIYFINVMENNQSVYRSSMIKE